MEKIKLKAKVILNIYMIIYFIVNLITLTRFPFVHSDEPWLAGLSRGYSVNHTPFVSESFFDLFPRNPHMIKVIFHYIQILFIKIFGYNIFSVRLISLIAAMITLYIVYLIFNKLLKNSWHVTLLTILISLNIQFIYGSHFARQESIVLLFLVGCYYIYRFSNLNLTRKIVLVGGLIGLCIGFHPNSFIIGLVFGLIMLRDFIKKRLSFKQLLICGTIVLSFALFFVTLSFVGDMNFINNYKAYGATLNVSASIGDKLLGLDDFYIKLYNQIGGTYYLPNIKLILIGIGILSMGSLAVVIISKIKREDKSRLILTDSIMALLGINLGIIIIGRYNATSIIFIIPFGYFILAYWIKQIKQIKKREVIIITLLTGMILFSLISDYNQISIYMPYDYENYLESIEQKLPSNPVVLGNLSAGFLFKEGRFYDIRNLSFLKDNNMTVEDYIKTNHINTIIYYEELDYIHRNKQWQILYGDDSYYYDDLNKFIDEKCSLVGSFNDSLYGMRIVRYMQDYPWKIKIYSFDEK